MEKVLEFLVENYIWVAAISGFIIIVLVGIVVSTNKKRKKKEDNPDVVSVSEESTTIAEEPIVNNNEPIVEPVVNAFDTVQPIENTHMGTEQVSLDKEEDNSLDYNPYATNVDEETYPQPVYNVELDEEPVNMVTNETKAEEPISIPIEEPKIFEPETNISIENIHSEPSLNSWEDISGTMDPVENIPVVEPQIDNDENLTTNQADEIDIIDF